MSDPTPPPPSAAPPPPPRGDGGGWQGDEQTLVGPPPPEAPRHPASAEPWDGAERTLAGPVPAPAAGEGGGWDGAERTLVGAPAGSAAIPPDPEAAWRGGEATQLGEPADPAPRSADGEAGTGTDPGRRSGTGTRTSPTMDDGWHLGGRKGPLTGTALGDYLIGGILGEGAMGTVYRGRQASLRRRVAVKVLPPGLAADGKLRERFEQEARTASLLESPHVVQVYGAGAQDGTIYFVMEYVDGTDLQQVIHLRREQGGQFTAEEASGFILQAARGLAEAGKHQVVHRDIKPANMMITAKGLLKIADFGISKVAGEHGLTMTGTAVGTPAYCSPEQGRGDPVDPRADIYSLGVVFYELLTGRKPFDGTTANALIYQHNYAEPTLPREVVPSIGEAYQSICLKCLMKDPAKRYQQAGEVVADLERVRDGSMSLTAVFEARFGTGAEDAMVRMGLKRRHPWLWPAVALVALLLAGGGGWLWFRAAQGERGRLERELGGHRAVLAQLDQRVVPPASAADELAWWARHVGKDADWTRWSAKLKAVRADREVLTAAFAAPGHLPHEPRLAAQARLDALRDAVGDQDPDVVRWSARLAATGERVAALRQELAALLAGARPNRQQRVQAAPLLDQFAGLAGDRDPDLVLWRGRLAALDGERASVAARLAALDQGGVGERRAQELRTDLVTYVELAGPDDPRAVAWGQAIDAIIARAAGLRQSLGRFGSPDEAGELTVVQSEAIGALVGDYRALAAPDDPLLVGWSRALERNAASIAALRLQLARLDDRRPLSAVERPDLEALLARYRSLVTAGDAQLAAWTARMGAERDAQAGAERAVAAYLEQQGPATREQRAAAARGLEELDARAAVGVDRKVVVQRRLADDAAEEARLRELLAARIGDAEAAADEAVTGAYDALLAIAGPQDAEVARWSVKLKAYRELLQRLAPLDRVALPPERSAADLDAFAALVGGGNTRVQRWRTKLERIAALRAALAPLDRVASEPADATAMADELVERLVGEQDPTAVRWRAKAHRIAALRARLGVLFARGAATDYVLPDPAGAAGEVDELVGLVGSDDRDARWWGWRVLALRGPGRPAWAGAAERDAFGVWADLPVGEARIRLRWIPAGVFALGSPDDEPGRDADESRIPAVTISQGFWLCDSECTQALWSAIMGADPSRFHDAPAAERPVERVSWEDAQAFLGRLQERVAAERGVQIHARLPSEAEWEYACRAGAEGPHPGADPPDDASTLADRAWFGLRDGTRGVRRRAPNRLGLFDMQGNVWEWCRDRYGRYSTVEVVDPEGRQETTRVVRGGSWADPARSLRAANRLAEPAGLTTLYIGFRFALAAEWPDGRKPERPGSGL